MDAGGQPDAETAGGRVTGADSAPGGDLARLLAAEAELDAALAEARREAERRVEAAREQAAALRREASAELERELAEMRERVRDEHREEVEEIHRRAEGRARRYRETSGEIVDRLARHVVRRLVEAGP